MKNNTMQEYEEDIAFKIIEATKSKNYSYPSINYLNNSQEISKDDQEILNNIKRKQELLEQNIYSLNNTHKNLDAILSDLNIDVQRYSINIDKNKKYTKGSAIKFIAFLFLIGLALGLIIYKPALPKAAVMIGKYYIFEDSNSTYNSQSAHIKVPSTPIKNILENKGK